MKKIIKATLAVLIGAVLGICVWFYLLGQQSQKMALELGPENDILKSCSGLENCAGSRDTEGLQPISTPSNPISIIKEELTKMGMPILRHENDYLHAIEMSSLFGFVDDIEFYYDGEQLHYRSASRVGRSDLGMNKKRLQKILSQIN